MADAPKPNLALLTAARIEELSPAAVEAGYEAAMARNYVCPEHGDVGLKVDGLGQCKRKGCGAVCERTGEYRNPALLAKMLSIFSDWTAAKAQVMAAKGLKLEARRRDTHNHLTLVFHKSEEELAAMPPEQREMYLQMRLLAAGTTARDK